VTQDDINKNNPTKPNADASPPTTFTPSTATVAT
jgi:hypothetical protein